MLMAWSCCLPQEKHLPELEKYCQTWVLTVNQPKTKVLIFQKNKNKTIPVSQSETTLLIGDNLVEQTKTHDILVWRE